MGLLDSILASALKGTDGQAETQALPGALSQILGRTDLGIIGGLLAQLQKSGLDRQVASWLGNGANLPISPDQLKAALGHGPTQQIGNVAGVPEDQLMKLLTQLLPGAVDRMSPNGTLEEVDQDEPAPAASDQRSLGKQAGLDDIK